MGLEEPVPLPAGNAAAQAPGRGGEFLKMELCAEGGEARKRLLHGDK